MPAELFHPDDKKSKAKVSKRWENAAARTLLSRSKVVAVPTTPTVHEFYAVLCLLVVRESDHASLARADLSWLQAA